MSGATRPTAGRTPSRIRAEALSALRQTIARLKSPECMLEVRKASPEVRERWADALLRCDAARDGLELAQLAVIRDGLQANDAALAAGAREVDEVLGDLRKLAQALDAIAAFVDLLARAAALVV